MYSTGDCLFVCLFVCLFEVIILVVQRNQRISDTVGSDCNEEDILGFTQSCILVNTVYNTTI